MGQSPRSELSPDLAFTQQEIARLAGKPGVRSAFSWFRSQEPRLQQWQLDLARIAAPPFGESARSRWLLDKFNQLGLEDVHQDQVGNVFGTRAGHGSGFISLSAHLDTVFPAGTPLNVRQQGSRLYGPGVSDNGAGVTAMLAIAAALQVVDISHAIPLLFVGNVGEEGEGDLRGMRHIFSSPHWRNSIHASLILDGAGTDTIVAEALGSRRFEVIVRGPGGHSWSDFGVANPIVVLSRIIHEFAQTPVPATPKTTFNVGVIRGGTSVNSIPESASMRVDVRSTSGEEMEKLERAMRQSADRVLSEERQATGERSGSRKSGLSLEIVLIGDRPAGELDPNSRILQAVRAADSFLGNSAHVQRASTDANIPLSIGREAIAIGGGGSGGGAHTLQEWFECSGRELGLKRILLTLLVLAGGHG